MTIVGFTYLVLTIFLICNIYSFFKAEPKHKTNRITSKHLRLLLGPFIERGSEKLLVKDIKNKVLWGLPETTVITISILYYQLHRSFPSIEEKVVLEEILKSRINFSQKERENILTKIDELEEIIIYCLRKQNQLGFMTKHNISDLINVCKVYGNAIISK